MNAIEKLNKSWGDYIIQVGFGEDDSPERLGEIVMHIYNMGGMEDDELDAAMEIANNSELCDEFKKVLFV